MNQNEMRNEEMDGETIYATLYIRNFDNECKVCGAPLEEWQLYINDVVKAGSEIPDIRKLHQQLAVSWSSKGVRYCEIETHVLQLLWLHRSLSLRGKDA